MSAFYSGPFCLSKPSTPIDSFPFLHHSRSCRIRRLRPTQNPSSRLGHFYRLVSPITSQVSVSRCTRILRSSPIHIRVHDREQGRLRRYLFKQELDRCRSRHVFPSRNKPNGTRNVWLSRVASQCRLHRTQRIRGKGSQRLFCQRTLSTLCPPAPTGVFHFLHGVFFLFLLLQWCCHQSATKHHYLVRYLSCTTSRHATGFATPPPILTARTFKSQHHFSTSTTHPRPHAYADQRASYTTTGFARLGFPVPRVVNDVSNATVGRRRGRRCDDRVNIYAQRHGRRIGRTDAHQLCAVHDLCITAAKVKNGSRPIVCVSVADCLVIMTMIVCRHCCCARCPMREPVFFSFFCAYHACLVSPYHLTLHPSAIVST